MTAIVASTPSLMALGWLAAGLGLGVALVTSWHRLSAWRQARMAEWDPY